MTDTAAPVDHWSECVVPVPHDSTECRRADQVSDQSPPTGSAARTTGFDVGDDGWCRRNYSVGVEPLRCQHGHGSSHPIEDEDRRCERDDRETPIKVIVTETVEFEVTIDPTEPRWEWLQSSPRAEWPAELDAIATETDGPVEHAIKHGNGATGAWREVTR